MKKKKIKKNLEQEEKGDEERVRMRIYWEERKKRENYVTYCCDKHTAKKLPNN